MLKFISLRFGAVVIFLSFGLVGCGGGGGGGDPEIDLYQAYEKVGAGMQYAAVQGVVGAPHNAGQNALPTENVYRWETGSNTSRYTLLSITVDNARGVIQKAVNGPSGNFSTIY